jgi:hypothetical protein
MFFYEEKIIVLGFDCRNSDINRCFRLADKIMYEENLCLEEYLEKHIVS